MDVFSAANPLLVVTRLVGLAPFVIDNNTKTLNVFHPCLFYSGLMLVLFTANAIFLTYTKFVYKDKRIDSYVGLASDVILLTSGIVVTVSCILFSMIQRKKYVQVVHDLYAVAFEMTKLNLKIPYKRIYEFSRRHIFGLFSVLIILFVHTIFYIQNLSNLIYASYLYAWFAPKLYNFLMESQFISGVLLLKIHFNLLNKALEDFAETKDIQIVPNGICMTPNINELNGNREAWTDGLDSQTSRRFMIRTFSMWREKATDSSKNRKNIWSIEDSLDSIESDLNNIKIIRKIHCSLCDTIKSLNSAFSVQLLSSVAQSFIFITANLYMIFTTISSSTSFSAMTLSYPILGFLTHTVDLFIVVLTCTNTSKAANYTAVLVHKILAKDCTPELRNQLKLFSVQLLHRKVFFTAAGFFNLDMSLLQAIIGAATTYLVILIQFHNTYEVPPEYQ